MHDHDENITDDAHGSSGNMARLKGLLESTRLRFGASKRQFAVFTLLTMVAATMWARPAGLLIWHRLRIITGMPRMAVANEDPEMVARTDFDGPESLDAGKPVRLDEHLLRDPFTVRKTVDSLVVIPDGGVSAPDEAESGRDHHLEIVRELTGNITISGTARGLGTAVLDGRVRSLGTSFEKDGVVFTLVEVRSGAVLLEAASGPDGVGFRFLVDRAGVRHMPGD